VLKVKIKIDERIGLYCEIFHELYDRISKVIPEHAVEIALGIFEEIAKDLRSEQIVQWKIKRKSDESAASEELATPKQREAIHKFGIKKIPEGLSKEEASEILERLISFSKEGDSASIEQIVDELNQKWTGKKERTQQPKK
jgi:hypothetical protein